MVQISVTAQLKDVISLTSHIDTVNPVSVLYCGLTHVMWMHGVVCSSNLCSRHKKNLQCNINAALIWTVSMSNVLQAQLRCAEECLDVCVLCPVGGVSMETDHMYVSSFMLPSMSRCFINALLMTCVWNSRGHIIWCSFMSLSTRMELCWPVVSCA